MKLDHDTFLALKRHFVPGTLHEPSPVWLTPERGVHLGFSGSGVDETETGCTVDFGTVTAIGEHRRIARVENLGGTFLAVRLRNPHPWLQSQWASAAGGPGVVDLTRTGDGADLELIFRSDSPEELAHEGTLQLVAESEPGETHTFDLVARVRTRLDVPFGRYDFHGSAQPAPRDFGLVDPIAGTIAGGPYVISIESLGPAPLEISLQDLPDWLSLEMDGYTRKGPAPGTFFERKAPVRLVFRPFPSFKFLGPQTGRIRLSTNDVRPQYRQIDLDLSARIGSEGAYVYTAIPAAPVVVDPNGSHPLDIPLINWGSAPARLTVESRNDAVQIGTIPFVPGASGSQPGQEILQVFLNPRGYPAGRHILGLTLQVEDGTSTALPVQIPILVTGDAAPPAVPEEGSVPPAGRSWRTMALSALLMLLIVMFLTLLAAELGGGG